MNAADDDTTREGRQRVGGRRRTVARLAAVQALYQLELNPALDPEAVVREFARYRFDQEIDGDQLAEADPAFFADIVRGVAADQRAARRRHRRGVGRGVAAGAARRGIARDPARRRLGIGAAARCAAAGLDQRIHRHRPRLFHRQGAGARQRRPRPAGPRSARGGHVAAMVTGADDEAPGEFERIRRYFAPLAGPGGLGLLDDAALVDCRPGHRLVVTADAIVAGVHYLPEDPPELIAKKLLRVNLSDLAAMGARPLHYLLTTALPAELGAEWIAEFAARARRRPAAVRRRAARRRFGRDHGTRGIVADRDRRGRGWSRNPAKRRPRRRRHLGFRHDRRRLSRARRAARVLSQSLPPSIARR